MRVFSRKVMQYGANAYLTLGVWFTLLLGCLPAYADIPAPPAGAGNGDTIQQSMTVFDEAVNAGVIVLYVITSGAYVGGLLASFMHAKKNKEWGQFGVVLLAGAIMLVVVLIILNKIKTAVAGG